MPALREREPQGHVTTFATLVLYEWLSGPRTDDELMAVEAFFEPDVVAAFGSREAPCRILFRQVKRARQRQVDLAIAACAIEQRASLWTLNLSDFRDLPGLAGTTRERAPSRFGRRNHHIGAVAAGNPGCSCTGFSGQAGTPRRNMVRCPRTTLVCRAWYSPRGVGAPSRWAAARHLSRRARSHRRQHGDADRRGQPGRSQSLQLGLFGLPSDVHGVGSALGTAVGSLWAAPALSRGDCLSSWRDPSLAGVSQSMLQLMLFRALQGLGAGGLIPLALTIIGEIYTLSERTRMQAVFSSVWGVSSVVGPLVGGVITDTLSWRWVFYLNLPIGLVAAVIVDRTLPEQRMRSRVMSTGRAASCCFSRPRWCSLR